MGIVALQLYTIAKVAVSKGKGSIVAMFAMASCENEEMQTQQTKLSREESEELVKSLQFMTLDDRLSQPLTRAVAVTNPNGDKLDENGFNVVIFEFEDFGRTSKRCTGFGLCKVVWFPRWRYADSDVDVKEAINTGATILERDQLGNLHADFLLKEPVSDEIATQLPTLEVDEDLDAFALTASDTVYQVKQGSYAFDRTLGTNGGYRVMVNQ